MKKLLLIVLLCTPLASCLDRAHDDGWNPAYTQALKQVVSK
jgi:hypothetical protein